MTSISPAARNIPGSVSQCIKMRNDIRGIINQRGSPTLFITLNPSDYHHPIVSALALRVADDADLDKVFSLSLKDRMIVSLKHPSACAMFFDAMVKAFIKIVLRVTEQRQQKGLFGHCDSYYGTVETQGRGSLHCHMLIWLRGHLPPDELCDQLKNSDTYRRRLSTWLDHIADSGFLGIRKNSVDPEEPANTVLQASLEPHPGTINGPQIKDMDPDTFEMEMKEHIDDLLTRYNWHRHTGTCWKYLAPKEARTGANCRFGLDGSYRMDTEIDQTSGSVALRRRHPRMTSYNPIVTFLMKCNTDLKFVGSGEEAKAFMYYVTDYITKAPLSMHAGLSTLSYAIRQLEARGLFSLTNPDETSNLRAITIAVNSMLGHQELSHPQVLSFIMRKGEYYTCETFRPFNWGEVLRYVTKSVDLIQDTSFENPPTESGASQFLEDIRVSVSREQGSFNASNILMDYMFRPTTDQYESMGLYTFIAWCMKTPMKDAKRANTQRAPFSSDTHPQFSSHGIRTRKSPSIPVLLGPKIAKKNGTDQEREMWARDIAILFIPWRTPAKLKRPESMWLQTLDAFENNMNGWEKRVVANMSLLSEARKARDDRPRHNRAAPRDPTYNTDLLERIYETSQDESHPNYEPNVYCDIEDRNGRTPLSETLEGLVGSDVSTTISTYQTTAPMTVNPSDMAKFITEEPSDLLSAQIGYMRSIKYRAESTVTTEDATQQIRDPINENRVDPRAGIITLPRSQYALDNRPSDELWLIAQRLAHQRRLQDNPEQLRAFEIIATHVIRGDDQLLMYVGGGGTGKSYLIQTIVMLFENLGISRALRIGAPTGIAASLIGGQTLHCLLSLNPSKRTTVSSRMADEWKGVKYVLTDEVSMLGAQFMATMSNRLKKAKGDDLTESHKHFGGLNVIFLGDFYQLPPPKQASLYAWRLVKYPSFMEACDNLGIDSLTGAYLWRQVQCMVLLSKNQRQAEDSTYAQLLDHVQNSRCTLPNSRPVEINGRTIMDHLKARILSQVLHSNPTELGSFTDAPIIVGSKALRDALNVLLLSSHARRLSQAIHLYHSTDFVNRKKADQNEAEHLWSLPSRSTCESLGKLPLFQGMRVMLTENISVPLGIVNGSEGVVQDITYSMDDAGRRKASVVYVHIAGCPIKAPNLRTGIVPLFPTSISIKTTSSMSLTCNKTFRRHQMPLIPAYSYTDYKSQGRTLDRAIVDIASARGQGIYVMLSRIKSSKGLIILRPFPPSKIQQSVSGELREELKRINALDSITACQHKSNDTAPETDRQFSKIPDLSSRHIA